MNDLILSLEITALGMGLVFAAIILLWWMMALLTRLLGDKASPAEANLAPVCEKDIKAQAAAVAVALAMAEHRESPVHPLSVPPATIVSAWQLGMRTRQLSEKGTPIVRKPRKVG